MKISDYRKPVYLDENKRLGEKCFAYCMDGHPSGRGGCGDMASHIGLPSCHCSDYFYFDKDAACFVEITKISKTKENMKERYSYISWADDENMENEFFKEFIAKENILKMYGSIVILCWFAHQCGVAKKHLHERRKYKFFLVVDDFKRKDPKGLDAIKKLLNGRLKSIASGFVAEVSVFGEEEIKSKIAKEAMVAS
ncbi:MAG: hypothetical protein ACR2P5_00825 [Gammaproteobacteria bacterium]